MCKTNREQPLSQYDIYFLIYNLIVHIAPLLLFMKLGYKVNHSSKYVCGSVILVYLLYLYSIKKDPIDVYFTDDQLTSFEEIIDVCNQKVDSYLPICAILELFQIIH